MNTASSSPFRRRLVGTCAVLLGINAAVWLWALLGFHEKPVLLGTALIAYGLGLRHALDADHIASIDNVTRKLMQQGQRPLWVGFFFALGHSTVVLLACYGVYATASAFQGSLAAYRDLGSVIGTSVSTLFLVVIALMNAFILRNVYRTFQRVRRGEPVMDQNPDEWLAQGGFFSRMFRPLFRLMSRSWHMYPLGFLFGLGFDTSSEVALLGISAASAANGLALPAMMVFPLLFTAGMTLVDAIDGILMVSAYAWAFVKPTRKLYYNLTITFVSVIVALFVGGVEAIGLLRDKLALKGGLWDVFGMLNDNFGSIGYAIVGLFILSWVVSMAIYRVKGFDRVGDPIPR
ncbi:MAG TPA: HoxN/HupN/NixA family nickel/cobalt transporter [Chthoniobacterales bacterium]